MSSITTKKIKNLQKFALKELERKSQNRSTLKPIKQWKLTCIENVNASIGKSVPLQARDYIQALEMALWSAGFMLEKELKKA